MAKSVKKQYAIGVDYGTNSVRALVVDVPDGERDSASVYDYPSGEAGILLDPRDPNLARQNPADYIEGFYQSVRAAVGRRRSSAVSRPTNVIGIGIDTTGSTPIPVDRDGHAAGPEAGIRRRIWRRTPGCGRITRPTPRRRRSRSGRPAASDGYLAKCGGSYSSEWYWSKILHCKRVCAAGICRRLFVGRTGRFHSGVHYRQPRSRHDAPQHLRRGAQSDVSRPVGRLAEQAVSQERRSGAGGVCATITPRRALLRSKGGRTDGRGCQEGRTCRRASPWPSALSMPTWARSERGSSPARLGQDHRYQHL